MTIAVQVAVRVTVEEVIVYVAPGLYVALPLSHLLKVNPDFVIPDEEATEKVAPMANAD
jgi:hypothetical protein